MKKIYKYLLIAILSTAFFSTPTHQVSAKTINGAYDVSTSLTRDDGIIYLSISGKLTKEGAERWSEFGASLSLKSFQVDGNTSTGKASIFSNGNVASVKCTVTNTGSGSGNAVTGDKFYCSTRDPKFQLLNSLDYGWYIFGLAIGDDSITGKADKNNPNATDLTAENNIFVDEVKAVAGSEDTVGIPSFSVTKNKIDITGKFNEKASEFAERNPEGFSVQYGKINKSPLPSYIYAELTKNKKLEIKKGAQATFSSTLEIDEPGDYIFAIQYAETIGTGERQGTIFLWMSQFVRFTVDQLPATSLQLVTPITPDESDPANPKVTIKVLVNNITETGDAFIQLGHVDIIPGGASGSCVLDESLTSEKLAVSNSGDNKYVTATFSGASKLPTGIYCVGARAGSMEKFTSFTGKKDFFKIGNITIPDTLTIDPNANQFGCVIPEGDSGSTTGYCLLAPLPGVGDETGFVDTSKGIEKYINNLIRLVLGLILVLSVLMVVVGGIEYMSTVNIGEKEGAKHRITQALLGLMVALGSYAILNTINPNLVNVTIHIPGAKIQYSDDETEDYEDPTRGISNENPPVTPPSGIEVPDGDAVTLAKQVLANSNINLMANVLSHNEPSSGPKQNVQDTADGKSAWRSSWGDKGHTQVNLSPQMLAGLLAIANQGIKIQVNAIAGGDHSSNSTHYYGTAFDLQSSPNDLANAKKIMGICHAAGANYTGIIGPCNNKFKKGETIICPETGYRTNEDHQTHIHCNWSKGGAGSSGTPTGSTVAGSLADSCKAPTKIRADMCEGVTKSCAKYAARIDQIVSDKTMARILKINMVEESSCKIDSVSPPTDSGYAYGIFQLQPKTAQDNISGCGISNKNVIDGSWLRKEENIDKIICIQRNFMEKVVNKCGTDLRNIGAGQQGLGWCDASVHCSNDKSCIPSNSYVKKWECPWDDEGHTRASVGTEPMRESARKFQYCSDHPGSWMK